MSTPQPPTTPERPVVTDHLSVRPSDIGPAEVHFLFEQQEKRLGGALGASILAHVGVLLALFLITRIVPESVTRALLPDQMPKEIVWLVEPGPGGGGGGGNKSPEPPKKAIAPGKDAITVPVSKPPEPTPEPVVKDEPVLEPKLDIPARASAADAAGPPSAGVLDPNATGTSSTGSGTGSGAGSGTGSGLGPGSGGGTGGGVYQVGNGVVSPVLLIGPKPAYTSEAMRAKIQGVVLLQCVVEPDGSVTRCSVQRSLDKAFGLDQEAIKAAQRWRFRPGTRLGEPVAVQVGIEMSFTLR